MKTFLNTLLVVFFAGSLTYAQSDCKPFIPTKEGAKWELTNYNAKGKSQSRTVYELVERLEEGDDVTFKIHHTTYDNKDKEIYVSEFEAKCVGGVFEMDMAFKMTGTAIEAFDGMEVEMDASEFDLPDLSAPVGTALDDGTLIVKMGSGDAIAMTMTMNVINREVVANEKVETPAGWFDAVAIKQDVTTKMVVNVKGSSKEWYAENIGLVKAESYNKGGKLIGITELTMLEGN